MQDTLHPLVVSLNEKRVTLHDTHSAFARRLGVDRKVWMYTKAGRWPVRNSIRMGAARLAMEYGFDDLKDLALAIDGGDKRGKAS